MAELVRHRPTKGSATDRLHLNHRATPRLHRVWPGTILDCMWLLNSSAHQQLAPFGKTVGIPFLLLSVVLDSATVGWFNRRRWQLTVFLFAIQVLGDLVNVLLGPVIAGGVGVAVAGALLLYLLRANVKSVF
jgi:predicted signal transduction protein with EAL and GGDEF domain